MEKDLSPEGEESGKMLLDMELSVSYLAKAISIGFSLGNKATF
jgi:hypothetical protein